MTAEPRSKKFKIILITVLSIFSATVGYAAARAWQSQRSIFISGRNPVAQIASLIFDGRALAGESRGQINVLLLGVGGPGHEGPYLSDTIMVASIRPDTSEIALISIPRDTLISIPGDKGKYKANHAYALGVYNHGEKVGLTQARTVMEDITGLDIPYGVVADFSGFTKAVDHLGGIDVQIEKTFTDSRYPDNKNGYIAPVTFTKGVEHMDGERALIYARSRYTTSDFDRAHRQHLVLEAFNARVKELNLVKDLGTINKLFGDIAGNISTNMEPVEAKRLAQILGQMNNVKVYSTVLDPNNGILCSYISSEAGYHLYPCPGRRQSDVHKYVEQSFARGHIKEEKPSVNLQNSTGRPALTTSAAEQLTALGYQYTTASAGPLSNSRQTTVYDFTDGKKPDSLAVLLTTFSGKKGDNKSITRPASAPDFVVVLGTNYSPPRYDTIDLDPPKPKSPTSTPSSTSPTVLPKATTTPPTTNPPKNKKKSENEIPESTSMIYLDPAGGAGEEIPPLAD